MNLRDALARKQRRETYYDLLIADPTEAEERHGDARASVRLAQMREDETAAAAARAELEDARAALAACTHRITFRNLPPDVFESLVGAHPPTKDRADKGDQWDPATFGPALIAACAVDGDMDEKAWIDELGSDRWSVADRDEILSKALQANVTPRSVTVPKG